MALSFDEMFPPEGTAAPKTNSPKSPKKAMSFDEMFPPEGQKPVTAPARAPMKTAQAQPWELGAVSRFQPEPKQIVSAQPVSHKANPKNGKTQSTMRPFNPEIDTGHSAAPAVDLGLGDISPSSIIGLIGSLVTRNPAGLGGIVNDISKGNLVTDVFSDDPKAIGRTQARERLVKEIGSSGALQAKSNVMNSVGGLLQAAGENIPVADDIMLGNTGLGLPTGRGVLDYIAGKGKAIISDADKMKADAGIDGQRFDKDSVQWRLEHGGRAPAASDIVKFYGEQAIANAPNTVATAGAAMAGAPPWLLGSLVAAPTFGQTYGEDRREGMLQDSKETALMDASVQSIIELIGESPVLDALGKNKFMKAAVLEPVMEALTGGSQSMAGDSVHGRDVDLEEAWKQTQDGAVLGAITSGGFAALGSVAPTSRATKLFNAVNSKSAPTDARAAAMIELATMGFNDSNTVVVNGELVTKQNAGIGKEDSKILAGMLGGEGAKKSPPVSPEAVIAPEAALGSIGKAIEQVATQKAEQEQAQALTDILQTIAPEELGNIISGNPVVKDSLTTEQAPSLGSIGQAASDGTDPLDAFLAGLEKPVPQAESAGALSPETPKPAGQVPDRRKDAAKRQRVDEMTPDQMRSALLTSPVTAWKNRRAYDESPDKPWKAFADLDGLKEINDTYGHEAGDMLIATASDIMYDAGVDPYHLSGDEFAGKFDSEEELDAKMQKAQAEYAKNEFTFTLPDGKKIIKTGLGFSYGKGQTLESADAALKGDKQRRKQLGLREGRRDAPDSEGVYADAPEGNQADINQAPERKSRPVEAKAYRAGKTKLAVQMKDGTWMVRNKKQGQWQPWQARETFDASPAFGYQPHSPASGIVRVNGKNVVVGEKVQEAAFTKDVPSLLDDLPKARWNGGNGWKVGLDRDAFKKEGIDPRQLTQRVGFNYVFRKEDGMSLHDLREWMENNDYLPEDSYDNDALYLLMTALGGEKVYNSEARQAVLEEQENLRQEELEAEQAANPIQDDEVPFSRGKADEKTNTGITQGEAVETPASKRLTDAVRSPASKVAGGRNAKFLEVPSSALPQSTDSVLKRLSKLFGVDITIVRDVGKGFKLEANGVRLGGNLYILDDTKNPVITVVGHELGHEIQFKHPDLYKRLIDFIRRNGDVVGYRNAVNREADAQFESLDTEGALVELTNDAMGDAMTDIGFWKKLAKLDPTLFQDLAKVAMDFIDNLTGRAKDLGSDKFLKDVNGFRNELAEVLREVAKRQNPIPEATQAETIKAAEQAKAAKRNGATDKRSDMMAGDGELFAGERPEQGALFSRAQTETQNFKAWSNNAPLVTSEQAESYPFKTGENVVVEAFHGTKRPDRIGNRFRKNRATSGPMAFHTSSPVLGSNYASSKSDTSIAYENTNYENWFKVKLDGDRGATDIVRSWYRLPSDVKETIRQTAPKITFGEEQYDADGKFTGQPIIVDENETEGLGGYAWEYERTRRGGFGGNPLKALVENWLNSGSIFNREEQFMEVLKLAGFPMKSVTFDSPTAEYPAVYKNYIHMQSPLVTNDIPQSVVDALNSAARKDRSRAARLGADMWDKNTRTLREWVDAFNEKDRAYVWTSIPDKVTALFKSLGYDGIIDWAGKGGNSITPPVYIPFEENQVKSAISNNGNFDRGKNRIDFSRKKVESSKDWTFSPLARMVEGAPLKQVAADQWKKWISANATKMGVKADELEYTGINEWLDLQQGKVTKEAIAEYLDAGGVQVTDVMKREDGAIDNQMIADAIKKWADDNGHIYSDNGAKYVYVEDAEGETIAEGDPSLVAEEIGLDPDDVGADAEVVKFTEYRVAGGDKGSYRELLLTLPNKQPQAKQYSYSEAQRQMDEFQNPVEIRSNGKFVKNLTASWQLADNKTKIDSGEYTLHEYVYPDTKTKFTSSHWDEQNILAHIRFDTRKDADGNSVLFIHEIQSDWGQKGRKDGFRGKYDGKIPDITARSMTVRDFFIERSMPDNARQAWLDNRNAMLKDLGESPITVGSDITVIYEDGIPKIVKNGKLDEKAQEKRYRERYGDMIDRARERFEQDQSGKTVTAPFVTDTKAWVALAIKRMIRYAVDNDIEKIAFISGEQAADLYDLSKQVKKLVYNTEKKTLSAYDKDEEGAQSVIHKAVEEDGLADFIGKEAAKRLIETEPNKYGLKILRGQELKVGGEGMKAFYDRLVPQVANDVLKKLGGGKVEPVIINERNQGGVSGKMAMTAMGIPSNEQKSYWEGLSQNERDKMLDEARNKKTKQLGFTIPQSMRDKVADGDVPLFARRQPVGFKDGKWQGLEATKNDLVEDFQDRMVSWKKIQNQIEKSNSTPIEDAANVYRLENLMHGKVSDNIKKLERSFYAPISKEIDRLGLTADDVQLYMIARHAPERNASIAQINPNMPDGGSGVNTAEAEAYMAAIPQEKRGKLDAIARRIDALVEDTRKRMLESGMIDQSQYNGLKKWKYYAPLRGKQGAEAFGAFGAKGVDVRGKLIRNAMGRGSGNGAENVLGEIIGDSIKSVIAAERATVGRAVLRLVSQNPSPLWQIDPVQTERYINSAGEVAERTMSNMNDPAVLVVKHKGKAYSVKINDDRLVQAIKAMDSSQLADGLKYFAMLNRYFSAVLTQYNPAFVPVNAIRDFTFGLSGLAAEHGAVIAANASAHYPQAARAAYRHSTGKAPIGKMGQYADEFAEAGGQTGYMNMDTVEELQQKIKSGSFGSFNPQGVAAGLRGMADFVSDVNSAVENALRLSAFAALRDSGMSADAAAEYAKNMTVNFNRKGRYGANLNAIILFFNAAMQGATRAGQLVRNPKILAGLGALAGLQALLAMYAMGIDDDETGEPLWNTIPDYVKRRNLVIPTASGKVYYLPLQYGFNVFPYMAGRTVDALTQEDDRPQDSAANLVGDFSAALLESFFPVPLDEGAMGVIPHFIKPFIEIERNKDGLGRRIRDEPMSSEYPVPRSTLGRPDTPEAYKGIAKGLNRMAGGTDYVAPARPFDWAPEDIEHLLKTFTGGAGQFVMDSARLGEKVWSGLDVTPRDIPILKRFMSQTEPSATSASLFYDRREEIGRKDDQLRDILKRDGAEAAREFFDNSKEFTGAKMTIKGDELTLKVAKEDSVFGLYKAAQKAAKAHRELVREQYEAAPPSLIPNAKTAERSRLIRESELERAKVMSEFNRAWREASDE